MAHIMCLSRITGSSVLVLQKIYLITVILEVNAWINKCEWGKFGVFGLKCYLINVNGVIDCELKTATNIITNELSEQLDHKCTYNIQKMYLQMYLQRLSAICAQLGAGKPAGALYVHA